MPAARPRGSHREQRAKDAAQRYAEGASIREIAAEQGVSYGAAYNLLRYAGVTLRPRGGNVRKRA